MANIENGSFNINLVGEQAQQLFLNPVFFDADVKDLFDTYLFVNKKQKFGYASEMGNILQTVDGCGWTPKGNFAIYERCIETESVKANVELCFDEFKNTMYQQLQNVGTRRDNMEGTIFMDILLARMVQAIKKQMLLLAFYGDKSSVDNDVNLVDGMWTVYLPQLVANNLIPYINSNSGTPLGAGDGIDLLNAVYNNATNYLKATPSNRKVLLVSANVYEQYLIDLQNNGISSAGHLSLLVDGTSQLMFNGVEVKPMYDWQAYAQQYLGISNANFVLYTERKNLTLGTDIQDPFTQVETWYERYQEKLLSKVKMQLGFNYKHNEFLTVAY